MAVLPVFMTFDADPDGLTEPGFDVKQLEWRGLELLPAIDRTLRQRGIRYTAFWRIDLQIRDLMGDCLALYHRHRSHLETITAHGNEVGWHPHLYARARGNYRPETNEDRACAQLREIFEALSVDGPPVQCARVGGVWHTARTMATLDELGIRVDSTALPGRVRREPEPAFDWTPTPNAPYHPSRADYRVPGKSDALNLLEVPMTTAVMRASHDSSPLRRYLNLAFHESLFQQGLCGYLAERSEIAPALVLVFHPAELLDGTPNGLLARDYRVFERNLDFLCEELVRQGRTPQFLPLSGALKK